MNEGLSEARTSSAAPEFSGAGVEPGLWDPWTPIGVLLTQHVLFGSLGDKLWRDRVRRVAPAAWDLLCGPRHPGGADGVSASGSNAWAVAAARSATDHPFVAGDPHRFMELPGVYQQVRLACPEFDVVGLAFAGVPGMPHFAHAGEVAWGITNAMSDCHDVFVEELRRTGGGRVPWAARLGAGGRAPRGGPGPGCGAVEVEVLETDRGPVVVGGVESDRALSVRMVPRVEGDAGLTASWHCCGAGRPRTSGRPGGGGSSRSTPS